MTILEEFKNYLQSKKISKTSVKNYLSDIRRFLGWSAKNNLKEFNPSLFLIYKSHLINLKTPSKSINRYLSSLRRFGKFLKKEKLMMINPAERLTNLKEVTCKIFKKVYLGMITKFKQSLKKQRLKPATVKNYISDINQFLGWLTKK